MYQQLDAYSSKCLKHFTNKTLATFARCFELAQATHDTELYRLHMQYSLVKNDVHKWKCER